MCAERPRQGSSILDAVVAALNSRAATLTPGTVIGASVYLQSGDARQALLACLLAPPAVAAGRIAAEWVRLLRPSRVLRRSRRRGS
jgi:hypothetical protein